MPKPKAETSKPSNKPASPPAEEVAQNGSQAAYDAFLSAAQAVPAGAIVTMRADPQLALQNVQVGVASVLAEGPRLSKLPETDAKEIAALGRLALAVVFATTQVTPALGTADLASKMSRGAMLRRLLLQTADALALSGLLPAAALVAIRAGHGKLDAARDLVALSALFTKHAAAIRGKHAVSAAELKEAALLGTDLLTILKPARARRGSVGPAVGADERDRLWTLLVRGHDKLWRAGAYLFGRDEVDAKVPSLQAHRGGRGKKATPKGDGAPT